MKVYVVVTNTSNPVKIVTTNKEKAEAVKKDWNRHFNMSGDYSFAIIEEKEVED